PWQGPEARPIALHARLRVRPCSERLPGHAPVAARVLRGSAEVGGRLRAEPRVPQLTRMPPILQKITVPYEYPVYFTVDVFDPGNPDLVEALSRKELSRRHRVFVVVERAVAEAWPGLSTAIAR